MSEKRVLDMPAETDKKPKMTSEEKIEAGKIELMKVVEGVQGHRGRGLSSRIGG